METWEFVLILVFLTICIIVISKQKVPVNVITLLDSPIFQIVILGLTLCLATISPPVTIVAITALVLVYYMRNVVKIQMVSAKVKPLNPPPRISIIEERRVTTIQNTDDEPKMEVAPPVKNNDVIERALQESEMRPPNNNYITVGNNAPVNRKLQVTEENVKQLEKLENPRGSSTNVESFDTHASFHSNINSTDKNKIVTPELDSDIFLRSKRVDAANENLLMPNNMREYNNNDGQYAINEPRPSSLADKYEVARYNPDDFIGDNIFTPVGTSINDKISNLTRSKFVNSAPPPDFDKVTPNKMY